MSSFKLKLKFLSNLKFDERYVINRIVEVAPEVNIRDVHVNNFFAFVVLDSERVVSSFFDQNIVDKLQPFHLKPVPSQDSLINKSIFITKLRPYVTSYSYEEILSDLNNNNPYKAHSLYKLQNDKYDQVTTLKVIFQDPLAVEHALNNGIKLFNIKVKPSNIHRETITKVQQCYKCFSYSHTIKDCTLNIQKCSLCGKDHHYSNCKSPKKLKCLNCHGSHSSTFQRCPFRKSITNLAAASTPNPNVNASFPPLPQPNVSHSAYASSTIADPVPSTSNIMYSSALKTPPTLPPPPQFSSVNPLPSKLTKLTPRSIVLRNNMSNSTPMPPPSSTIVHPLPPLPSAYVTPDVASSQEILQPPTTLPPLSDLIAPPPPPSSQIPPVTSIPSTSTLPPSTAPNPEVVSFANNLYIPFKVADKMAERLAGPNTFLYGQLMNHFLQENNLSTINLEAFYKIANIPIPTSSPAPVPSTSNSSSVTSPPQVSSPPTPTSTAPSLPHSSSPTAVVASSPTPHSDPVPPLLDLDPPPSLPKPNPPSTPPASPLPQRKRKSKKKSTPPPSPSSDPIVSSHSCLDAVKPKSVPSIPVSPPLFTPSDPTPTPLLDLNTRSSSPLPPQTTSQTFTNSTPDTMSNLQLTSSLQPSPSFSLINPLQSTLIPVSNPPLTVSAALPTSLVSSPSSPSLSLRLSELTTPSQLPQVQLFTSIPSPSHSNPLPNLLPSISPIPDLHLSPTQSSLQPSNINSPLPTTSSSQLSSHTSSIFTGGNLSLIHEQSDSSFDSNVSIDIEKLDFPPTTTASDLSQITPDNSNDLFITQRDPTNVKYALRSRSNSRSSSPTNKR